MTLLERLKYLNAEGRLRKPGEDLAHWADRDKEENLWVRDIALPLLLELAEEAKAAYLIAKENDIHHVKLGNVLAKLEAPHD